MAEDKAVKAFVDASHHKLYNPYQFADKVRLAGIIPASALHKTALAWFRLMEIEYRYGIGDPVAAEMGARIVHEVIADYEELPNYNPSRGFEADSPDSRGTWEDYERTYSPTFIRRGFDN